MFNFDAEKPSKIVATSTITIYPNHRTTPMVWTVGLKEFYTRRVFIVCTITQTGRPSFRFYPLQKKEDKAPPAFVIVPPNSHWLEDRGTHLCFKHPDFAIIRPLKAVYFRVEWCLKRKQLDYLPNNLLTLVKHLYFRDFINDSFIEKIEKDFSRLEKILSRAEGSTFQGEREACIYKSFSLCEKIFKKCKEVLNYE